MRRSLSHRVGGLVSLVPRSLSQPVGPRSLSQPVGGFVLLVPRSLSHRAFCRWLGSRAPATVLGAVVEELMTWALFGEAPVYPLVQVTSAWLLQATLFVAVVLVASCLLDSTTAASGAGLGVVIAISLLGLWGPAARRSPAGLGNVVNELAAGMPDVAWGWPVGTTVVTIVTLVALAVVGFRRREL